MASVTGLQVLGLEAIAACDYDTGTIDDLLCTTAQFGTLPIIRRTDVPSDRP